jgi:hypothetical protein
MTTATEILREFGLPPPPPGKDRYYTTCPKCSAARSRQHQNAACLGVTITNEGVSFGCNHCEFKGGKRFENGRDRVRSRQGIVAEFSYHDEDGNTLFVVERRESPTLNGGKPNKKIGRSAPIRIVLANGYGTSRVSRS